VRDQDHGAIFNLALIPASQAFDLLGDMLDIQLRESTLAQERGRRNGSFARSVSTRHSIPADQNRNAA